MKKIFTLILLSALVFGCDSGDPVVDNSPKTLFTFTSDLENIKEMWIILRDSETGDLIDAKQVVKNVPLVFESEKKVSNDKLSVTQLYTSVDNDIIFAGVYNGVDIGSVWADKDVFGGRTVKGIGTAFGSYSLRVSNVPETIGYTLSDGIYQISGALNKDVDVLSGDNITLFDNTRDQVLSIYPATGKPKYQFFNSIENKAIKEISYTNMKEYEKIVNVKFPQGMAPTGSIVLQDGNNNYTLYENFGLPGQPDDLTEINLGFLSAFNNYYISLNFDDYGFQYLSNGPAPNLIQYVDPELFVINNRSIDKFSATASHEYTFRAIHYIYDDPEDKADVDITYYDPSPGARHNDPFTPELISKFSIPMNKVTFESASFVVAGQTYDQWKAFYFDPTVTETSFVNASVSKK